MWENYCWSASRVSNKTYCLNIFLSDLFPVLNDTDIASDADDNTLDKACNNIDAAVNVLRKSAKKFLNRFNNNQRKGNAGKWFDIKYRRCKSKSN